MFELFEEVSSLEPVGFPLYWQGSESLDRSKVNSLYKFEGKEVEEGYGNIDL